VNLQFSGKRVSGLLTILPENERLFVEEMANYNFSPARSLKLKEVMGYDRRRIVRGPVCVSDLAVFGIEHLFATGALERSSIGAIVFVTQSPDFLMPGTASVVHGRLGLGNDVFCIDINQGCAGFLMGLMQAFMLLEQPAIEKVVLVNADVLSRKVSPRDRNSYPLIGDGASITVVERSATATTIFANLKMDGSRGSALTIPAGGLRLPCSAETAAMHEDAEGNARAADHLVMDGSAVFNFVMSEVPPLIEALLQDTHTPVDEVDAFLCHQPNRFMLQKLAEKLKVPFEKMPSNVVEYFGNSSGVTIPVATAFNLGERLKSETLRVCLAGFGVGLTWSAMLMDLGPLDFCEMIDFKE
jgi:3-oxoacyl-[acyl-carrier-protein] synthase-3